MTTALPPPRILLVDDIEENLIALEALLRRLDVELVLAHSGNEALERLLTGDFALALLDVNMPEMDGFQLAELMRGSTRTRHIPIMFVTAAYEPARAFQGYEAGGVDFLFKPVEPRIMLSKVKTFLTMYDQQRKLAAQLAEIESVSAKLTESLHLHETFVAALNHDLRTPLHTISLGTAMLEQQLTEAPQRAIVRRVASASDRMSSMLDQLYDLARTRVGNGLVLERSPGDLATIVEDIVREAELHVSRARFAVTSRGDTSGEWDVGRLARVVGNLVTNARTHGTADSPIEIDVDGTDLAQVVLTVRNQGLIPPDLVGQIFEPFRRGRSGGQGLGLGLYIVREITLAHGGEVIVESAPELGTRFVVRLPRRAVSGSPAAA